MKNDLLYCLILISVLMTSCTTSSFKFEIPEGKEPQTTTYYFLRHAEKDTSTQKDPELTEEGIKRANYMADYFSDKDLEMFYSTDYTRTIQTLIPIIHQYKGEIQSYDAKKDTLFTEDFWKSTYGKNVLVVGHSNTNPGFVNEILSEQKYDDMDESNYDDFFKVEVDEDLNVKDSLITKKVPDDFTYN